MNQETRQFHDEWNSAFAEFKHIHKEQQEETKKFGEEMKETRNMLEKIHERMDEVETKMNRPKIQSPEEKSTDSDYTKAFNEWVMTGKDSDLRNLEKKFNFPLMNETIDTQGGYLVPPEFSSFIVDSLVQYSPIRQYATNITMRRKEFRIPVQQRAQNLQTGAPATGLFKTSWGQDLSTIDQTDTGLLGQKTLVLCDINALPFTTLDLAEDNFYGSTESYVMQNLVKSIAYEEGYGFTLGDGVLEPTGILNPTVTADYSTVTATGAANTIGTTGNLLFDAFYELPDWYARNGTWFMNRQTIRIIREWVDGQGQYLLTSNYGNTLANDAPATILGRPYQEIINMPAPNAAGVYANGSIPILFGDMKSAYYTGDPATGMYMLRDPYTSKGIVKFFTRTRVAGNVILPEALVKIELAS
ncbi:MAG: phage major capsid protein [Rhizobiales bacterium]|nr:phage major capsid protein [Hyphomicrobiales bacterium]